jgi:hypothetical protein
MQSLSDGNQFDAFLPDASLSKGAKRGHQIKKDESAKKAKVDPESYENRDQHMKNITDKVPTENSDGLFNFLKLRAETELATEDILVPDVGISDLFALSKHEGSSNISQPLIRPFNSRKLGLHEHSYPCNSKKQ